MAIFGVLALVGLFLFANFQGFTNGAAPVGNVTIWGTLPAPAMQTAIQSLEQAHPEFTGTTYIEKPVDGFDAAVADALAAGSGPDLVLITQEQLASEQNKLKVIPFSSISERTYRDTYLPEDELYLSSQGSYAIPFVLDPLMLYYNRPILASAGAALPPSNWEAVTGLSPAITRISSGQSITRSTVALGTYDNIENARAIISLLFFQAGNKISGSNGSEVRSTLASQTTSSFGTTPTESALNFYTEFANSAKTIYSWNRSLPSSRQAFVAGDLALYFGYASEISALKAANPNLDFDMAPVPQATTGSVQATYGQAYAFAIPKVSKNASGAFRAAIALTGKDVLPTIAHALGMAPAQRKLLVPTTNDLYEPLYFPQALIAHGWLSPAPSRTDTILATMISNVESGRLSASDAIQSASLAIDAAFK